MLQELGDALDHTSEIVASIPRERYGAPTPCPDFDVQTLLNHMVAGNVMFTGAARGEQLDLSVFGQDHIGDSAASAYRRSADEALEAWHRPGALEENL